MASERPNFKQVYGQYLAEMGLTFPELEKATDLAMKKSFADFSKTVAPVLHQIAVRDASIFTKQGVLIAPGVVLTKKLWDEAGKSTQKAIWDYLSSLVLLASYEQQQQPQRNTVEEPDFTSMFDISGAEGDLKKMFKDLGDQFSKQSFSGFFDGMKEAAENMKAKFGVSGEIPPIPERLFKGHIAKIAEEMARDFNPEDFGIPADMLESNDTGKIFEYLQTVFTQKPELLMSGAKKIANRIQDKLKNGEVRREDLIKEAEELMGEFQNNPMFKQVFEQLGAALKGGEGFGGNTGPGTESERRRIVQERLRKKMEAKKNAKK
jgi:hypothetical protein